MMKIQTTDHERQSILRVEGRLAGEFVPGLEKCRQTARADRSNAKISVDLKSVTCLDQAARYLLQLHSNGVSFQRAGLRIHDNAAFRRTTGCEVVGPYA
jgi:hypothetical protein